MLNLKNDLKVSRLCLGSWVTLIEPAIAEILAQAGFDYLVVDMEHSAITLAQAQELIRVIDLCGVVPLVRVGENDPNLIKRVMDIGAHGIIVPMVNKREDAIRAVRAVKYPPVGTRGVGLARAQGYGFTFDKYKKWVNKNSIVIVQIEHINGVNNLEDILSVVGVDGSIIGPYDLSASLGEPGAFNLPKTQNAIRIYEEKCRRLKKIMGIHVVQPDADTVKRFKKKGYRFIAVGFDALYLGKICRETLQRIKT